MHTKKILKERYKVRERYGLLNIVGTLRYRNADADVRTEERLGIEHCACQLCHRLTSAHVNNARNQVSRRGQNVSINCQILLEILFIFRYLCPQLNLNCTLNDLAELMSSHSLRSGIEMTSKQTSASTRTAAKE